MAVAHHLPQTRFDVEQRGGQPAVSLARVLPVVERTDGRDDYSRYIIAWMLRTSMQAADVMETLDLAQAKTGVDQVRVVHRPRLLSDNGPCYVSGELADYLEPAGGHPGAREQKKGSEICRDIVGCAPGVSAQ